jgi:hypothetical protein
LASGRKSGKKSGGFQKKTRGHVFKKTSKNARKDRKPLGAFRLSYMATCIFCGTHTNREPVEHIVPEGLVGEME